MVFSNLIFIFIFLPLVVGIYYLMKDKFKNIILLLASLFFYAWGEPVYILLLTLSIAINFMLGNLLVKGKLKEEFRKKIFIISLIFNIGVLVYFKYMGMILSTLIYFTNKKFLIELPSLPLGISFYTFQILSYVIDIYKAKIKPQKNITVFALYISMFPQLVAGPIINYKDVETQLKNRRINSSKFIRGMGRFLLGLSKKVILADTIGQFWNQVKNMPDVEISVFLAWAGIIAFTLQIYFDFSGYSDMAIGLGSIFGFDFKENFNYPYTSLSISDFWRRWHISLGNWFKEYVYIPLGGNTRDKMTLRNIFIVWSLTGIWHGASWNFLIWGSYFGFLIIIEKIFMEKFLLKLPRIVRHCYTLFFVVVGWVLFEFTNMSDLANYLRLLFGLGGNAFISTEDLLRVKSYLVIFMVCILAYTSLPRRLIRKVRSKYKLIYNDLLDCYYSILIILTTAFMVASTYNPFIYFRF